MSSAAFVRLLSVNVGLAAPLEAGGRQVVSGIRKHPVAARLRVGTTGLDGDEQADPTVHGGIAKAVYAYPHQHYAFWQTVRAQAGVAAWGEALPFGALGENLTIEGLAEAEACVGDVLRFPDCELAISEPRMPCFKFNAVMGFAQAAKLMQQSGWCGFYLTVLRAGSITVGETAKVLPGPRDVGIAELFRARARRG